jgi:hypothetical protein
MFEVSNGVTNGLSTETSLEVPLEFVPFLPLSLRLTYAAAHSDDTIEGLVCCVDLIHVSSMRSFQGAVNRQALHASDSQLLGGTTREPIVVDWEGTQQAMVIFEVIPADVFYIDFWLLRIFLKGLRVRHAGSFALRYRVFDVFSVREAQTRNTIAERVGNVFTVFGDPNAPSRQPTELSKVMSLLP